MKFIIPKSKNNVILYLQKISTDFPIEMNITNIEEYAEKLYKYAKIFFLENNTFIIGMVAYYDNDEINKIAYISSISVMKEYQTQGFGQVLLDTVIKKVIDNNIKFLKLEVQNNNQKAINFYKKNAFTEIEKDENTMYMLKKL